MLFIQIEAASANASSTVHHLTRKLSRSGYPCAMAGKLNTIEAHVECRICSVYYDNIFAVPLYIQIGVEKKSSLSPKKCKVVDYRL